MSEGTVKWFDSKKGFGFILADSGDTIFVHYSDIISDKNKTLTVGERVAFESAQGPKGVHAANVKSLPPQ